MSNRTANRVCNLRLELPEANGTFVRLERRRESVGVGGMHDGPWWWRWCWQRMRCFGLLGGFGNLRGFLAAEVGGGWRSVAHFPGGGHGGDRMD